jgi:mannitol/fructose-specific phosphotransferase system IIA component (Ntr-type)
MPALPVHPGRRVFHLTLSFTLTVPDMTTLADFTAPALIVPRLRNSNTPAVVGELCSTLERAGKLKDPLAFYNEVISRETLSSTAVAPGWAMPHGRTKGAEELCMAVGRTAEPFHWLGNAGQAVQMVFLFVVPESKGAAYLRLISALARLSKDPFAVVQLLEAPDAPAVMDIMQRVALRPAGALGKQ